MSDKETRGNSVDPNFVGSKLFGRSHGQIHHCRLGRSVGPHTGQRDIGGHRGHIDNRSGVFGFYPALGEYLSGNHQTGQDVHIQYFFEGVQVGIHKIAFAQIAANPVYQDIRHSELLLGFLQGFLDSRFITGVDRNPVNQFGMAACLAHLFYDIGHRGAASTAPQGNLGTGGNQAFSHHAGQYSASAGNYGRFSAQIKHLFYIKHTYLLRLFCIPGPAPQVPVGHSFTPSYIIRLHPQPALLRPVRAVFRCLQTGGPPPECRCHRPG